MSLNIEIKETDNASPRIYKAMKRSQALMPKILLALKGYRLINKRGRNKLEQV